MNEKEDHLSSELEQLQQKERYLEAINFFATALFEAQSIDQIVWTVTQNAMEKLGYYDCIIYLYDKEQDLLIQKAAHGPKNPEEYEIAEPITIKPGKGIVGTVFKNGKGEIIGDTSQDPRYIVDDEIRFSEIAVPMFHKGEPIGIIDCEHPDKNYFSQQDFELLTTISALVSTKIAQARANEELISYQENLEGLVSSKTEELERKNQLLETQNKEKELLLREVHHRVKNNLQIMVSLVNLQVAAAANIDEKNSLKQFGARIRSMAIIHEHLYAKRDMSVISIDHYITDLVNSILQTSDGAKEVEVNCDIEPIKLDLDTSIPLGLILNELVTNSIKHAFDDLKNAEISIFLRPIGSALRFEYKDNGKGLDLDHLNGGSFGMDLLEILSNQIGRDLHHENENGYRCRFTLNS